MAASQWPLVWTVQRCAQYEEAVRCDTLLVIYWEICVLRAFLCRRRGEP